MKSFHFAMVSRDMSQTALGSNKPSHSTFVAIAQAINDRQAFFDGACVLQQAGFFF